MQNNLNILKNKIKSTNMSSAKKNEEIEKDTEKSKTMSLGKGRELHKALMSDSGFERAQAMGEIAMMIFGGD